MYKNRKWRKTNMCSPTSFDREATLKELKVIRRFIISGNSLNIISYADGSVDRKKQKAKYKNLYRIY